MQQAVHTARKLDECSEIDDLFDGSFYFITDLVLHFGSFLGFGNTLDMRSGILDALTVFTGDFDVAFFLVNVDGHFKFFNDFTNGLAGLTDNITDHTRIRITSYNVCYTKLLRG